MQKQKNEFDELIAMIAKRDDIANLAADYELLENELKCSISFDKNDVNYKNVDNDSIITEICALVETFCQRAYINMRETHDSDNDYSYYTIHYEYE
jgi:hypothetical protein